MKKSEEELQPELQDKEGEPLKVMLAEDDVDDQELFRDALRESGTDVQLGVFDNGAEIIKSLKDSKQDNPDLIFLDLNMPLKDGKETLKEIKQDDRLKDIPAVVLSTSGDINDIRDSFEGGAATYIEKANSFSGFVLLLKKVFFFHWAGMLLRPIWKRFFLSEKNVHNK